MTASAPFELMPASAHQDAIAATQELVDRLEAHYTPPTHQDLERYGYIPFKLEPWYRGMLTARVVLGPGVHSYLEIGSGVGTKLCLARALGWRPQGIEAYLPYVNVSRQLFPHCPVASLDAHSYTGFQQAELIYCYKVDVDRERHDRLNRLVASSMKAGALYFCPSASGPYPDWLEHVDGYVWRKTAE
jgi:hypothetical protein